MSFDLLSYVMGKASAGGGGGGGSDNFRTGTFTVSADGVESTEVSFDAEMPSTPSLIFVIESGESSVRGNQRVKAVFGASSASSLWRSASNTYAYQRIVMGATSDSFRSFSNNVGATATNSIDLFTSDSTTTTAPCIRRATSKGFSFYQFYGSNTSIYRLYGTYRYYAICE